MKKKWVKSSLIFKLSSVILIVCIYIYIHTLHFCLTFRCHEEGRSRFFKSFYASKKKNHYDKIRFVMVTRQTFMIENNSLILTKKNYALVLIVRKKLCIPTFIRVQKCLKITNYDLWVFNVESQTKFMCKCCSCFFYFYQLNILLKIYLKWQKEVYIWSYLIFIICSLRT